MRFALTTHYEKNQMMKYGYYILCLVKFVTAVCHYCRNGMPSSYTDDFNHCISLLLVVVIARYYIVAN